MSRRDILILIMGLPSLVLISVFILNHKMPKDCDFEYKMCRGAQGRYSITNCEFQLSFCEHNK